MLTRCPNCLGSGKAKTNKKSNPNKCTICESTGYVNEEIAEDYISTINPLAYENEEIISY